MFVALKLCNLATWNRVHLALKMASASSLSEVVCPARIEPSALRSLPFKATSSREAPGTEHMLYEVPHAGDGAVAGSQGEELLEASFRGRQLKGQCLRLPDGYLGMVVVQTPAAGDKQEGSQGKGSSGMVPSTSWTATTVFDRLTYYNHDTEPSRTDVQRRALDWLVKAQQVHAPVSLAQVEAQLAAGG